MELILKLDEAQLQLLMHYYQQLLRDHVKKHHKGG